MIYELRLNVTDDRDETSFKRTVDIDDCVALMPGDYIELDDDRFEIDKIGYNIDTGLCFLELVDHKLDLSNWSKLIEKGWQ